MKRFFFSLQVSMNIHVKISIVIVRIVLKFTSRVFNKELMKQKENS